MPTLGTSPNTPWLTSFTPSNTTNRPDLARLVGRVMGAELLTGNFFDGIEAIIPVPLSPQRLRQRGYNQSEHIALGIAEQLRVPVRTDWIERTVDNPSQTTLAPE